MGDDEAGLDQELEGCGEGVEGEGAVHVGSCQDRRFSVAEVEPREDEGEGRAEDYGYVGEVDPLLCSKGGGIAFCYFVLRFGSGVLVNAAVLLDPAGFCGLSIFFLRAPTTLPL